MRLVVIIFFGLYSLVSFSFSSYQPLETLNPIFFDAVEKSDIDTIEKALSAGVDVDQQNDQGFSALMISVIQGNFPIFNFLIDHKASLSTLTQDNYSALLLAIIFDQKEMALNLLQLGADPNIATNKGKTPLHYVAKNNLKDIAELLLIKGADVHAKDRSGWTPIALAVFFGSYDTIKILLAAGANIDDIKETLGVSALDYATTYQDNKLLEILSERHKP